MTDDYSGPAELLDPVVPRAIASGHLSLTSNGLGEFAATLRVDDVDPALVSPGPARLRFGSVELPAEVHGVDRLTVRLTGTFPPPV